MNRMISDLGNVSRIHRIIVAKLDHFTSDNEQQIIHDCSERFYAAEAYYEFVENEDAGLGSACNWREK